MARCHAGRVAHRNAGTMVDAKSIQCRVGCRDTDLWVGLFRCGDYDAQYVLVARGYLAYACGSGPGARFPATIGPKQAFAGAARLMNPIRVLFITVVPSPYQRDLFRALAAHQEVALSVCYLEAAAPDSPWPQEQVEPYERILPGFWLPLFGARWHMNWNLPELTQYDFIVLNNFASATAQWLMRYRLRGKRWLFWGERLRAQPFAWKEFMQRKLIEPLKRATGIVGIGSDAEQDYRSRFPRTPHFCIPYHCDLTQFFAHCAPRQRSTTTTFFFCGQMIRRKGVDLLLIAFERLVAKGLDISLLLVGREAELPELLGRVTEAARARIRYEGFQPPARLHIFFAQADVFVLPSRHEGWGVVVNQALGAGLPVICSDAVGAGTDLVEENVNGLRFPAGDVDGLERCLKLLAASPDIARQWGEASTQKAYSIVPSAGAEKWVRVFQELQTQRAPVFARSS
jgi:glycosyltransferase involved in cell wall biosynthesis